MAYYPESLMPSRAKDESQDVKGNQYIICAADFNKHDEEIRAIEKALGVRSISFPATGFSGCGGCDPTTGPAPAGASSFLCFSCASGLSGCYDPKPDCAGVVSDVATAIANIFAQLQAIRDQMVNTTSGIVCIKDDSVGGVDGLIAFPTDWPITYLEDVIRDDSTDDEDELPVLDTVHLTSVTNFPDSGYVSIINDATTFLLAQRTRNLNLLGFTSLGADNGGPEYSISSPSATTLRLPGERVFGMGTTVEVMSYDGRDVPNKLLLNVQRKQHGTTSTMHSPFDLAFAGRLSIAVSPVLYKISKGAGMIDDVSCSLRSNGKIELVVRNRDTGSPDFNDDTQYAYAEYQATLIRDLDPIPAFDPSQGGECI